LARVARIRRLQEAPKLNRRTREAKRVRKNLSFRKAWKPGINALQACQQFFVSSTEKTRAHQQRHGKEVEKRLPTHEPPVALNGATFGVVNRTRRNHEVVEEFATQNSSHTQRCVGNEQRNERGEHFRRGCSRSHESGARNIVRNLVRGAELARENSQEKIGYGHRECRRRPDAGVTPKKVGAVAQITHACAGR